MESGRASASLHPPVVDVPIERLLLFHQRTVLHHLVRGLERFSGGDSTADLSPNFTNDFGITMVPIYAFRSKEQAGLKGISTEDNLIDDDVFQRQ